MSEWVNMHTVIAFILGVLLSAMVKMWTSKITGKLHG